MVDHTIQTHTFQHTLSRWSLVSWMPFNFPSQFIPVTQQPQLMSVSYNRNISLHHCL